MPPFACVSMANVLCILKSVNFLNIGFDWGGNGYFDNDYIYGQTLFNSWYSDGYHGKEWLKMMQIEVQ